MELENEKSSLHIVGKMDSEKKPEREMDESEAKRKLKHAFLIKIAVLTDIILRDKELTMVHVRDVTKLLGQITRFFDL